MQQASTTGFSTTLADAGTSVFRILFEDSNGDLSEIINKCLNEKGDSKEKAFSLLTGFSRTGLVDADNIIRLLGRISPAESDKHPILVKSYLESNPGDADCVKLMDALKDSHPELLVEIIRAKKNWTKATIRRHLIKYAFTEKLWIVLATMEEDLLSRK